MDLILEKFSQHRENQSDINEHLDTLLKYAKECSHITEMGVRWVSSTWALLYSNPKKLISYDIVFNENIKEVIELSKKYLIDYSFNQKDVLEVEIEPTDLLFIDTLHTYNQLLLELKLHSQKVLKYIILHDTETFGHVDENIYSHASEIVKNEHINKQGLMNAINDFLQTDLGKSWRIFEHYSNNNGLTILKNNYGIK